MKDAKHKQDVFFNKCQLSLTTSDFTTELDDDLPEPEDMFSIMTKNADSSEDEPPLIRKRHRQPCSKDQITIDSDDDLPEPEDLFSIITKKADNSENMVPLIGKHHRQPRSKDQITIDSDDNLPEPKDLFPTITKKTDNSEDEALLIRMHPLANDPDHARKPTCSPCSVRSVTQGLCYHILAVAVLFNYPMEKLFSLYTQDRVNLTKAASATYRKSCASKKDPHHK
jgi:hypothetical protein